MALASQNKELAERQAKAARATAIQQAWATGNLRYKLDNLQRKCYDKIEECAGASFYFNKARRVGGSYLLTVRAVEQCIRKPNAQVRYAAPTTKALRKIVSPNLRKVLADCPPGMRPKWSTLEQEYRFPNGSILALAGCDAQRYEDLRGTEADEIYMDEVGFIDELDYILNDVLLPQVQDTGGRVILVSTPPRSPTHPAVRLATEHMQAGQYFTCTVWDNPRKTRQEHEAFFKRLARGTPLDSFYRSSMFRREYLAEFIVDENLAVIPEWTRERAELSTIEVPLPSAYDAYVGIDIGFRDGCAYVLGYWDFPNARLVITDELLQFGQGQFAGANTVQQRKTGLLDSFQEEAMKIEKNRLGLKQPLRVCDNDLVVIDLLNSRKFYCRPADKHDKELRVNALRELIRDGKLVLHPRCVKLSSQLFGTIWNKNRTSFERSDEGHGDLLDALIYLNYAVARNKDPLAGRVGQYDNEIFHAWEVELKKQSQLEQRLIDHIVVAQA